jgi:hypothetical protein
MPKLSVAIERFAAKPEVEFIKTKEREFARSMASCSPSLSTAGRFNLWKEAGRDSNRFKPISRLRENCLRLRLIR